MEREIVFWDEENTELLCITEKDEAIHMLLDDVEMDDMPDTIEVCGWARSEITHSVKEEADLILSNLIERLNEAYGCEDGHKHTDKMIEASKVFVQTVFNEYTPLNCDIIKRETINVTEWIKKEAENILIKADIEENLDIICVLDNWKEFGFPKQPKIVSKESKAFIHIFNAHDVDNYAATFTSVAETKMQLRAWWFIKGDKEWEYMSKYKWVDIKKEKQ